MSNQMKNLIERRRHEIVEQRKQLELQLAKMEARLAVYDDLLLELQGIDAVEAAGRVLTGHLKATVIEPKKEGNRGKWKRHVRTSDREETVKLALEAAGDRGITARELAEVASMPKGTASGRLSIMKSAGRATHVPPRYFAVHSKQEDNNE